MSRSISGSIILPNLCMHATVLLPPLLTKAQGQGPSGPWAQQTASDNAFFSVYLCENPETLTAMQRHQTNDYFPFKKRRLHMLSFHVSFSSVENLVWAPMFHGQWDVVCTPARLPSPLLLYVCLSVCLYLFISAFWALLSCLLIFVNMGLTSAGQVSPLKSESAIALKTDL